MSVGEFDGSGRVLVIGEEGFIGSALLDALGESGQGLGWKLRQGGWWSDLRVLRDADGASYFEDKKLSSYDTIVNLAAHTGSAKYVEQYGADVVTDNSRIVCDLYAGIRDWNKRARHEGRAEWRGKVINLMANCMYPETGAASDELQYERYLWDGPPHKSVIAFAETRRLLWVVSHAYREQYGIDSVNLICGGVYGPGDHTDVEKTHAISGIIVRMLKAASCGDESFEVWGSPNTTREWIYIDDLVKLLRRTIQDVGLAKGKGLGIYPTNIGSGLGGISMRTVADSVKKAVGFSGDVTFSTEIGGMGNTSYNETCGRKVLSLEKAYEISLHSENSIPLDLGVERTVGYYRTILYI